MQHLKQILTGLMVSFFVCLNIAYADCNGSNLNVVVLGSGGPELVAERGSSGYLLRNGEKALFLIDFGSGASLNFARANAQINDLQAVLFTHLHVDHSADFASLLKAAFFDGRQTDLPILGPSGNDLVPDTTEWLQRMFGNEHGAFRYLSEYVDHNISDFKLKPTTVNSNPKQAILFETVINGYRLSAMPATHGPIPALSWRIEHSGCSVTFSGDTRNRNQALEKLAHKTDLLIASHAVAEDSDRVALNLHMPPSEIGRVAAIAEVNQLVLSHIMKRTEYRLEESIKIIKRQFQNKIIVAKDLDIYWLRNNVAQ